MSGCPIAAGIILMAGSATSGSGLPGQRYEGYPFYFYPFTLYFFTFRSTVRDIRFGEADFFFEKCNFQRQAFYSGK
jgi:hypothetical protein